MREKMRERERVRKKEGKKEGKKERKKERNRESEESGINLLYYIALYNIAKYQNEIKRIR